MIHFKLIVFTPEAESRKYHGYVGQGKTIDEAKEDVFVRASNDLIGKGKFSYFYDLSQVPKDSQIYIQMDWEREMTMLD